MSLDVIQIRVPRLHKRTGGMLLSASLAALSALSAAVALQHLYVLRWVARHDRGYAAGFEIEYFSEKLYAAWLPTRLFRGPHHQLALAACAANAVASVLTMALFLVSARVKRNFGQHKLLLAVLGPVLALDTTALVYAFAMHGATGRLDTLALYRYASPAGYAPYGGARWLDFESWSCGVRHGVPAYATRALWDANCRASRRGRWLLLPLWALAVAACLAAWVSFRGLIGWRRGEGAEYISVPAVEEEEEDSAVPAVREVRDVEGRVRLS
ncbi:hypothetical protein F4775DRAFT_602578 [Biscogniauxia sp. FL1348]|nr:hypothetical protein F4775DRAFT_602578 [Biscogniauxia sp. FL1348]